MSTSTSNPQSTSLRPADSPRGDLGRVLRGLLGAVIGGALGALLFHFALKNGFYAIVLPGAIAGMFCGGFMGRRYLPAGILCGIFATALTLGVEWWYFPFRKDQSLAYFVAHVHQLRPFKLALLALGPFLAVWFGMGREGAAWLGPRQRPRKGPQREAES